MISHWKITNVILKTEKYLFSNIFSYIFIYIFFLQKPARPPMVPDSEDTLTQQNFAKYMLIF